jgi:hypothetical protein
MWRRYDEQPRGHSLWSAAAAGLVLLLLCYPCYADDLERVEYEVCSLAPGLQGRIEDMTAASGVRPTVHVEHGTQTREGWIGCLVRAGDIIRPGAGTSVTIKLPDRQVKTIDFDQPLVIGTPPSSTYVSRVSGVIIGLLRQFAGLDASGARQIALGTIGATRSSDDSPLAITMPGMIGLGQQYVDGSRRLRVRWIGGLHPFHIMLASVDPKAQSPAEVSTTSESYAYLELGHFPLGIYDLIIAGTNHAPLAIRLHLVSPSDVPSEVEIGALADEEARELVNAVWLLTRAPSRWRLEALSRLEMLAVEHDDIVAQVILDPALQPHSSADR